MLGIGVRTVDCHSRARESTPADMSRKKEEIPIGKQGLGVTSESRWGKYNPYATTRLSFPRRRESTIVDVS